jgi:hypothetical protein
LYDDVVNNMFCQITQIWITNMHTNVDTMLSIFI